MENIKLIVGENLSQLRKNKKITQLELAEMFNYSDKAISKWEHGDTLPSIETLYELCNFYGVTLDYLTHKGDESSKKEFIKRNDKTEYKHKIIITSLLISFVWILATIIYIYLYIDAPHISFYQVFLWAVPISSLVLIGMNALHMKDKRISFWSLSVFIWSLIISSYVQFIQYNPWPIFILIVPIQISLILWTNLKK